MNRLQKRCLAVSTGFHAGLIGVAIFGAAFFVPAEKSTPSVPIKVYYPDDVVDKPTAGGNPTIKIAPPVIPTIKSAAVAPPVRQPEPAKAPTPVFKDETPPPEPTHSPRRRHEKPAPEKEQKPKPVEDPPLDSDQSPTEHPTERPTERPIAKTDHGVVIDKASLTPVVRGARKSAHQQSNDDEQKAEDARAEEEYRAAQARAAAARAEAGRRAHEIGRLVQNLTGESSSSTKVEMPGPGGASAFSANYRDIVWSIYHEHWRQPTSVGDKSLKVEVKITIARDGRVVGKRILKPSGNADMDRSIERTLDAVKFVEAFPAGVTDEERTFKITFDLESDQ